MRRQKTARPPRHPAEHEYHSGTLSNEPEGEGGGGWPFFLRDIGTTRAKIHGGCRDRTRVVGSATRAGRPRQETKKTGSQETAGAPTDGSWIALACTAARFALSVSGTGASRIPCAQLKPRRRCNKNGGRRPRGWGLGRDGAGFAFALRSDSVANARGWREPPWDQRSSENRRASRCGRALSARSLSVGQQS
jgi:hypothetical protein